MLLIPKIVCFIFLFAKCRSKKILAVIPTPSISHQIIFRPLLLELAMRGHEVTVITTDPAFPKGQAPQNLTEIDVHDISYNLWNKFLTREKGKESDAQGQIKYIFELITIAFEKQLKTKEVQSIIYNKKIHFDLVFFESIARAALIFSHLYKVPVIEVSSMGGLYGTFDTIGVPTHPLLYPEAMRQRIHKLTFLEKIYELYVQLCADYTFEQMKKSEDRMLKRVFGPNIPSVRDLKKNVQMLFLNVHPLWDSNRPVSPNVVYLGGLHQVPEKELPKDLKNFLDSSKNGVIYLSFGTNVRPSFLPAETVQILTKVFSQLPYDILWKWDSEEIPGRPQNVRISKWFPQSDLLRHPKIKLFITQGGLQSTDEALTAGVPLIGIPMLGDQWFNTEKYVIHNIGMKLGIETLTEDILKDAIETVIGNTSYRENVVNLRNLMLDQPQTPLERAVWWTEHVLRHGSATHLRPAAAHMHWAEYYMLDILIPILCTFIIILLGIIFSIQFVVSKLKDMRLKVKIN